MQQQAQAERWIDFDIEIIKTTITPKGWKRTTTFRKTELCQVLLECGHWVRKDVAGSKYGCIDCKHPISTDKQ